MLHYGDDVSYLCLNCFNESDISLYNRAKFINSLFSFMPKEVKCRHCKARGYLVPLSSKWRGIITCLSDKGYDVVDCSMFGKEGDKYYAYICLDNPLTSKLKPKFMRFISNWFYDSSSNVLLRGYENKNVLKYEYTHLNDLNNEIFSLANLLLKWVNTLPYRN